MMHVIQPLSIEPANYIHDVLEYDGSMKGARLRRVSGSVDFHKSSLFNIKLMNIIKTLLICVNAAKYVDITTTYDSRVSVPWLRRRSICPMNFIPVIRQKTVLEYVVHSVVAVPPSKDKHRVLINYSRMSKSVERLNALAMDFFPLVFFIFDTTFE
jgi:hypothetical protein